MTWRDSPGIYQRLLRERIAAIDEILEAVVMDALSESKTRSDIQRNVLSAVPKGSMCTVTGYANGTARVLISLPSYAAEMIFPLPEVDNE